MTKEQILGTLVGFPRLLDAIPKGKYRTVMGEAINVELTIKWALAARDLLERMEAQAKLTADYPVALSEATKRALAPLE